MFGRRLTIVWRVWACALALPSLVLAQGQTPDFTAPPGSARVETSPVYSAPLPVDSGQVAQDAVDIYRRTCLASVGDAGALVDLALSTGLAPSVGGPEGDTATASLLGDAPGQVYGVPGSSDVLLAISDDGRCTVWANRTDGPKLKQAFVAAIDAMRQGGATVKPVRDRTVQRGGGWRQQIGYDVSDARGAFSADAVTLLTPQPGMQVLRAAPSTHRSAVKDRQ